jgi:hypothetical protein
LSDQRQLQTKPRRAMRRGRAERQTVVLMVMRTGPKRICSGAHVRDRAVFNMQALKRRATSLTGPIQLRASNGEVT